MASTISACAKASSDVETVCDIILNGAAATNQETTNQLASIIPTSTLTTRVWCIDHPDKANALNKYFEHIWPHAETTFFVDGYVEVKEDAFDLLEEALQEDEFAFAVSGIPNFHRDEARSQKAVSNNLIHGNLFAMAQIAINLFRERKFFLPYGYYYVDGLLESFIKSGFEPNTLTYQENRVVTVANANCYSRPLSYSSPHDILRQFRRLLRQARGSLEQEAIRVELSKGHPDLNWLPCTSKELVLAWFRSHKQEMIRMAAANPLKLLAMIGVWGKPERTFDAELPSLRLTLPPNRN